MDNLEISLFERIRNSFARVAAHDATRLAQLLLRQDEFQKVKKKIQHQHQQQQNIDFGTVAATESRSAWHGWQQGVTVDWLMSGAWHNVEGGLRAVYDSVDEYAETLLRVWTLLSFYWGSGAVWPRCTHRNNNNNGGGEASEANACGEPLLAPSMAGTCTRKDCRSDAAWKCFRNGHDLVCKGCLSRKQDELVGEPGLKASTDIYDALVEREVGRREEAVYLMKHVESRKPPRVAPNWKTSETL